MIFSLSRLKFCQNLNNIVVESKCALNFLLNANRRYCTSSFEALQYELKMNKPFTMKFDSPQFKACLSEEVMILNNLFVSNGHELRIVGGAVRDLLLGVMPHDLDFSTTATPSEMKDMFNKNEIRLINANGEKHGTITSRINDKNFEVTTLRVDYLTNGRHAEVLFTKEWAIDANRRDLTVNAMYLGLDGTLYDYFNGYEDLKKRRLRFVGDASSRIQEDYLRILRYFRFYGVLAEGPDNFDQDILKAIQENVGGLLKISGERIWVEMNKILTGNFIEEIVLKMLSVGVGPCVGLPSNPNVAEFKRITNALKMKDVKASPMTLLTALFNSEEDINTFCLRVKPSRNERDICYFILNNRTEKIGDNPLRYCKMLIYQNKSRKEFVYELLKYLGKFDVLEDLQASKLEAFPVNGHMLKDRGVTGGKNVGEVLSQLQKIWFESDFSLSAEELLEHVPQKKLKMSESQGK